MDTQRRSLDPYDECFEQVTPRKIDTFSHRRTPCRYEPPIVPPAAGASEVCPFKEYCEELRTRGARQTLQYVLTKAYSERIKNVLTESSTSVVIRSEQQFHLRDLCRFAQRRHFYEVVRNGTPGDESRFGVGCTEINEEDRFGEYLGFVDLRQHYRKSALAFGLLVEPSWIREDPNTFVIAGVYGPLFGAHSFRSSVYAMQDSKAVGAVCGQMCAIMALGMLADRGVEVKGSFTLTYLAWLLPQLTGEQDTPPPVGKLEVGGLVPEDLREVLRRCGASAARIRIRCTHPWKDDLATRIIEANIYARFPVILAVDGPVWRRKLEASQEGHALVIVGVRRNALTGAPIGFIVHDPGSGPFMYCRTARCFEAAKAYRMLSVNAPGGGKADNSIHMVAAATDSIRRHVNDCVAWLIRHDFDPSHNLYGDPGGNPERFMSYAAREPGTDYRIRLLCRDNIDGCLGPFLPDKDPYGRTVIRACLESLPESQFWTVMGFCHRARGLSPALSVVWLFDAREDAPTPPVAKFWFDQGGMLIPWLRLD